MYYGGGLTCRENGIFRGGGALSAHNYAAPRLEALFLNVLNLNLQYLYKYRFGRPEKSVLSIV